MPDPNHDYRVVMCIPCGRKRNLEILFPYLLQEKGVVDEVNLWLNTNNSEDLDYITRAAEQHSDYFKCIPMPGLEDNKHLLGTNSGVNRFYTHCIDPRTVYIKCDDDICYIEKDAIKELVAFRLNNQEPLLIYPNIVNNVILNHLHQRFGCIPMTIGACHWNPYCDIGYKSGVAAEAIHRAFLQRHNNQTLDAYRFSKFVLWDFVRVSIGFILFFGKDFSSFQGVIEMDDEHFLSSLLPSHLNRPNVIYGKKLVSHFSYCTQRQHLETNTELLSAYKKIMLLETADGQE